MSYYEKNERGCEILNDHNVFGHSDFCSNAKQEILLLDFLEKNVGGSRVEMLLGGYGNFDRFAYNVCKKYKAAHPNVTLIFVSPYLQTSKSSKDYDAVIYPGIEGKPPKFAILYRNRYMVERADLVVVFVNRGYGGAYTAYIYAQKMGKPIFNLSNAEF